MYIIGKTFGGTYTFTLRDRLLYLRFAESPGPQNSYPVMRRTGSDMSFITLDIGGFTYYWPCTFVLEGLEYMHQEVFATAGWNSHAYEYGGIFMKPGDIVVDAGACEGFFTRYALEHGSCVISIEPVEVLADALKRTFSHEIDENRVSILNVALGSCTGQGFLSADSTKIFESHLGTTGNLVNVSTLDDLITTKIDFIKMDIEGTEVEAIYGAENIIRKYKPKLSIAVYHNYENARLLIEYLRGICPEYTIMHRGIYAYNDEKPRPVMVYAWR